MTAATSPLISVVLPVRDEPENIGSCLERLAHALADAEHEVLVCYDTPDDTTLPAIERAAVKPKRLVLVKNDLGRGPSFAMRAGIQRASGDVVVTSMADLCDPPEIIAAMASKIREQNADVVSGSRYMPGGKQVGGPPLKSFLSRLAGMSLYWIAGVGTRDATTNFRAFSRRLLDSVEIESGPAFSLGLELTVKAHLAGFRVDEVPSTWTERSAGESRFRLGPWLPEYLRYYARAVAAPLLTLSSLSASTALVVLRLGFPGSAAFRVASSAVAVALARRLRGRTTALDAALPVVVCLPVKSPFPQLWLLRGALVAAALVRAAQQGRRAAAPARR